MKAFRGSHQVCQFLCAEFLNLIPTLAVQSIAEARASVARGCEVEVTIDGAAGTPGDLATFFCNVQSNALDFSRRQDVLINAVASAVASAGCGKADNATAVFAAQVCSSNTLCILVIQQPQGACPNH